MINIKLKNGTQLVTKAINTDEEFWELKNPMILHITLNEEKSPIVSLVPFMIEAGANGKIMLNKEEIQAYSDVSLDLEKYYIQQTSGIDLTTRIKQ